MKFSIRLNNDLPLDDYVQMATAAERAGFDQFWVSHDLFIHSSPVILTACALATEWIELGTCIVNPYTLHPAEIAMTAATLDEISGGRFNLGIGAGAADFLGWVGIEQKRPLTDTRKAIEQIRLLMAGEPVPGWEPQAFLRTNPARVVPIYLGATSPKMIQLAGEVADGVLPLLFPPEHLATVQPLVAEGIERAGRAPEEVDLAACIWCSVSEDYEAAADVLRDKIAYYGNALSGYLRDRLGLDDADLAALEHALQVERDPAKARSLVTDDMLKIGIVGTSADLIPRLEHLVDLGATHLSFGPPLGPDPVEAIDIIGREVIPHFR
ncbi:MAG: LLM class flavin-dependent oxidoreductase [Chloroflexota bacterium]